mgnify:FL=1
MNIRETDPLAAFFRSPFDVPMAVASAWAPYGVSLLGRIADSGGPASAAKVVVGDALAGGKVLRQAVAPTPIVPFPHAAPVASWPAGDLLWAGGDEFTGDIPELIVPPQGTRLDSITREGEFGLPMIVDANGKVREAFIIRWRAEPDPESPIDDVFEAITGSIAALGGMVRLTGWSQGGWLSFIHTALHPESVHELTMAGSPIDFHVGGVMPTVTSLTAGVSKLPWVRPLADVMMPPVGAAMRTALVNDVWRIYDPVGEAGRVATAMVDPQTGMRDVTTFTATSPLTAPQYDWFLKHLVRDNELARGELRIDGELVDAARITCPVHLVTGVRDRVVEPGQAFATEDVLAAAGSPAKVTREVLPVGHMGLFGAGPLPGDHFVEDAAGAIISGKGHGSAPAGD